MNKPNKPKLSPELAAIVAANNRRLANELIARFKRPAPSVPDSVRGLLNWWSHKADQCEGVEQHYKATDRVTSQQAAGAKEAYRTAVRELEHVLAAGQKGK